ncbi:Uncharacterized protein SCF082_LOCUS18407 [Durusdinium trenchii]|uniref:Uncharacterized protein n=2 Tax=Durusdinium trenchii TaxID=1381693 RepID=A0ABP0KNV0_9DINO
MRIDILNTVREEMRDQVTVIISSLDNLMVVATLMLSIGFGFVVEGTFPPAEKDYEYDDLERREVSTEPVVHRTMALSRGGIDAGCSFLPK